MPWADFDRLATAYRADVRARRLTSKRQFLTMLYGQLAGAASLREIVGEIESHAARLYHLGYLGDFCRILFNARRARAKGSSGSTSICAAPGNIR
jgi:Domain of unknown function (DUF4372)